MLEMVPTAGLNDHVAPALVVPVTVAVNCWFCEAVSEAEVGATETLAAWPRPAVIKMLAATKSNRYLALRCRCTCKLM
jgi:hypothetical protein